MSAMVGVNSQDSCDSFRLYITLCSSSPSVPKVQMQTGASSVIQRNEGTRPAAFLREVQRRFRYVPKPHVHSPAQLRGRHRPTTLLATRNPANLFGATNIRWKADPPPRTKPNETIR
jgi:hypothetical protein